jgi:diacylglycerol O-acyltransferase
VWSYVDQLNISVLADHTVGDPHEVTDAMVRAFTEIRVTAGGGQLTKIANDAT